MWRFQHFFRCHVISKTQKCCVSYWSSRNGSFSFPYWWDIPQKRYHCNHWLPIFTFHFHFFGPFCAKALWWRFLEKLRFRSAAATLVDPDVQVGNSHEKRQMETIDGSVLKREISRELLQDWLRPIGSWLRWNCEDDLGLTGFLVFTWVVSKICFIFTTKEFIGKMIQVNDHLFQKGAFNHHLLCYDFLPGCSSPIRSSSTLARSTGLFEM